MPGEFNEIYVNLLDSRFVRSLMHSFYDKTGMVVGFKNLDGSFLGDSVFEEKGYQPNPFCEQIYSRPPHDLDCKREAIKMVNKAVLSGKKEAVVYVCHAGLIDLVVPVYIKNTHIANLVTGQVRCTREGEENFKKKLKCFPKKIRKQLTALYSATRFFI